MSEASLHYGHFTSEEQSNVVKVLLSSQVPIAVDTKTSFTWTFAF